MTPTGPTGAPSGRLPRLWKTSPDCRRRWRTSPPTAPLWPWRGKTTGFTPPSPCGLPWPCWPRPRRGRPGSRCSLPWARRTWSSCAAGRKACGTPCTPTTAPPLCCWAAPSGWGRTWGSTRTCWTPWRSTTTPPPTGCPWAPTRPTAPWPPGWRSRPGGSSAEMGRCWRPPRTPWRCWPPPCTTRRAGGMSSSRQIPARTFSPPPAGSP